MTRNEINIVKEYADARAEELIIRHRNHDPLYESVRRCIAEEELNALAEDDKWQPKPPSPYDLSSL